MDERRQQVAAARIDMLSALLVAVDRWPEVVELLNASEGRDDAVDRLSTNLRVTGQAAIAILDARFQVLTPWYRKRIETELAELRSNK